jgi:uncharacterized protein YjbI with pentapeptide repeats
MTWRIDPIIVVAAALAAIVTFGVGLWLWWWLPKWQVNHLRLTIYDPKAWADVEDNFRKTIGQLLVGAMVLVGAGAGAAVAYRQLLGQQQASRDLLVSNQVSKGFEQLGSDHRLVRLGGIYALEGVMNTSDQYHRPVLEALSAFVRDGTKDDKSAGPPASDIQAALTVIARRSGILTAVPDLSNSHSPKADLSNANLSDANLAGANLSDANLAGAHLNVANLTDANLTGADLEDASLKSATLRVANLTGVRLRGEWEADPQADLSSADLGGANLTRADLTGVDLTGANLRDANLTNADLTAANLSAATVLAADLSGTNLTRANMAGANLARADLSGANLSGTDLTGASISQPQLDRACGTDVTLDPGLTIKSCPNEPHRLLQPCWLDHVATRIPSAK